jgi:preprotein translocase SecE subunit
MAKSRAQRKAEAAKRRALQQEQNGGIESDSEAQHDTQVPESADVLEAEIAIEQGAARADRLTDTDAPAPSRADVGKPSDATEESEPEEDRISRRDRRRQEKEAAERAKQQIERRSGKPQVQERERGAVISFFSSVRKELQKVQWPDRDTLVQASAVTVLFVAVAAAYLGVLDAIFSKLVDLFIT